MLKNVKFILKLLQNQKKPYLYNMKNEAKYRIQNENGTFLNSGTGLGSWFTLEDSRKLVNYEVGQRIVEHDGVNVLWEVL